jgi:hypothetical protein
MAVTEVYIEGIRSMFENQKAKSEHIEQLYRETSK